MIARTAMVVDDVPHSRPLHGVEEERAAVRTLRSQMTAAGRETARLGATLAAAFDGAYAATCASGTLALLAALRAVGVRARDEVVLPTYVCPEVLDAVLLLDAVPALCDVDPETYAPSPRSVDAARTARTRAVILPHLFGIPADVLGVVESGIPVVEDLAQGLGARVEDRRAGSCGAACALSFKAIKMLSAGEGGAVVVRDVDAAARLRNLHERRDPRAPSFDFPMSDLTASVALVQWERLDEFVARRQALAGAYADRLADTESAGVRLPPARPGCAWFRYPVTLPASVSPSEVRARMAEAGVQVRQPVDCLLHRHLGQSADRFSVAEHVFERTLSLPIYPALTESALDRVVDAFRGAVARGARRGGQAPRGAA